MDLKEFDKFKEKVKKRVSEKYNTNTIGKLLDMVIRTTVEEMEKIKNV